MIFAWAAFAALGGLFAGSAIWTIARNQASERPLFDQPISDDGGLIARPGSAWLPLLGLGTARGGGVSRWRIPFEVLVAAYAALCVLDAERGWDLARGLVCAVPLLLVLLVDAWTRWIYVPVLLVGTACGLVFSFETGFDGFLGSIAAMAVAGLVFGAFFVIAQIIYRGARATPFGRGDVMLAMMIGAMVGLANVIATLFAGMIIAAVVLGILLAARRLTRQSVVAYGPYLCVGALLSLLFF